MCGSMIAMTINVQTATIDPSEDALPADACGRRPRRPRRPRGAATGRRDRARSGRDPRTRPADSPPATDGSSPAATPSSIRVSDTSTACQARPREPFHCSAEWRSDADQLGTRARSRTSPSDIDAAVVLPAVRFAPGAAVEYDFASRDPHPDRDQRAFCTTGASVHWWPPCRITRGGLSASAAGI